MVRPTILVDKRRVVIHTEDDVDGLRLSGAVATLFRSQPQTANYDHIYDLSGFNGDAQNSDIDRIVQAYNACPRETGLKYTCFVTLDQNFPLWARTMDEMFGDRRHLVFHAFEAAEQFLDDLRKGDWSF